MIGLVIRQNGKVIEKRFYDGDDEKSRRLVDDLKRNNPNSQFEEYTDKGTFENIQVDLPDSHPKNQWRTMRRSNVPLTDLITFLARHIGLE